MLKEVYCTKYSSEQIGSYYRTKIEIVITNMTQEQIHSFFEHPLVYIKNYDTDNDFVCPLCGASLS